MTSKVTASLSHTHANSNKSTSILGVSKVSTTPIVQSPGQNLELKAFFHLILNLFLLPRYEDALVLLLTEVLNRIQFRYNQAQLEELDDETLDDDVRAFLSCCSSSSHCF